MRIRRWVCLLGVTWPANWHMVSKPLSCFHPLFTHEENIVFSRKNVFSSSRMIATTVPGHRASSFTDTLNLSTPKSLAEENSASSLTVHEKKTVAFFQRFERLLSLSSRMNTKTPCYSRDNVRYRRVNLKTCDLVDEENLHRRHVIDSSHFNINNPFSCWRDLFSLWRNTPERAYEAVWWTPEAPFQEPSCFFLGTPWEGTISRVNVCCMSLRFGPGMLSLVSVLTCITYLYSSLFSVCKTSVLLPSASVLHTMLFVVLVAEDRWNRSTWQRPFQCDC
jgi:hypothetical protein